MNEPRQCKWETMFHRNKVNIVVMLIVSHKKEESMRGRLKIKKG